MTFNSSQQERLLTALERIADATERTAALGEEWTAAYRNPLRRIVPDAEPTDPHSTKGPYR